MSEKIISSNRAAYHNFHILETFEAGLELTGTEVKSARAGHVSLKDAYALIREGQAWLFNAHISPYTHGNRENHEPLRTPPIAAAQERDRAAAFARRGKGLTVVPTKFISKNGFIKCELAVARGRRVYDKRETEARKTQEREARAADQE